MKIKTVFAALALLAAGLAQAHSYAVGDIQIGHPWARATAPLQSAGGGYLKLDNSKGQADRLLSASAEVSQSVELHSMRMEGDVMRMRQVDGIDLPAGQTVELAPGGLHLMFIGLKAPLKAGDRFPLKLKFEKAGEVTVDIAVEAISPTGAPKPAEHKH